MKKYIFLTPIFLILLFGGKSFAASELKGISKEEDLSSTRIILDLSEIPAYELKRSGQRVDLFLSETQGGASLVSLPEDGKVVKILLGRQKKALMVSFLLRSIPRQVKVLTKRVPSRLVLEVDWERDRAATRLAIFSRPAPPPLPGGESSFLPDGWRTFFEKYESAIKFDVPIIYTLAPLSRLLFKPVADDENGEIFNLGLDRLEKGNLEGALGQFWKLWKLPPETFSGPDREAMLLFCGEALVRTGRTGLSRDVLEQFLREFPESQFRARGRYLLAYARAADGAPYDASYQLSMLAAEEEGVLYRHLSGLLQAELDLSTGRTEKAVSFLKSASPSRRLKDVFRRRLADALSVTGMSEEALKVYKSLDGVLEWRKFPYSLARRAEAAYNQKAYPEAVEYCGDLSIIVEDLESRGAALFGQARAALKGGESEQALSLLLEVAGSYSPGEGGIRAQLLLLDRAVLAGRSPNGQGEVMAYAGLIEKAPLRKLREEAAFKEVLLRVVSNPGLAGVDLLGAFLAQFRSGEFHKYAQVLMAEILPDVIRSLIKQEEYFEALVLVEKYRSMLSPSAMHSPFLVDLGNAFWQMGLLERAARVYSFVVDAYKDRPEGGPFFGALVQILFERGEERQVLEYVDQYLELFPQGGLRGKMLLIKGRVFHSRGELRRAVDILTDISGDEEAALLAGLIYWELQDLPRVEATLGPVLSAERVRKENPDAVASLAEAYFLQGQFDNALPLYRQLLVLEDFEDQARYRCAKIYEAQGQSAEALKFLSHLTEKGRDPRWKQVVEGVPPEFDNGN